MDGLEQRVFDFIQCQYKSCFSGSVKIIKTDVEYCLYLTLNNYMIPMQICGQCKDDDQFYKYITKELARRNLVQTSYFKLKLEHGEDKQG